MKNILLYLLLLFSGAVIAQEIVIPDANFKAKLLSANTTNNIAKDSSGDSVKIDANGDGIITQQEVEDIRGLNIESSEIQSLVGIEHFIDLRSLNCSQNFITILDATSLADLRELRCSNNTLTSLNVLGLENLKILECSTNELTVLDVTGLEYLTSLICSNNALTTLDLNSNISLEILGCFNNNLVTLFIKNGKNEEFAEQVWLENPDLEYICADESQIAAMMLAMPNTIQLNSYCSYEPGGVYNKISGIVKFDLNNDGCDANDIIMPSFKLKISNGIYEDEVFTKSDGTYAFYVNTGEYLITPVFENTYFTVPVAETITFPLLNGTTTPLNFCVHAEGVHPDIEVIMAPVTNARPGFDAIYKIVYKNKGNQIIEAGSVTCVWDSARLGFVNMTPLADVIEPNTYTWFYDYLKPFESREILMTLNVNSPTDTPSVNVGDVLPFTMTSVPATDETPADNNFTLNQIVVGSMDPNNIVCIQGENASPDVIGEYLHYIVNFENTGTAPATFVVVQQDINPDEFDMNSLQLINSSHGVTSRVNNNRVEFRFENVNLGVADHGNILYKIKTKKSLKAGDRVTNTANIYFDYNFPIETNDANTQFGTLGVEEHTIDKSIKMYPNPTKDKITISAESTLQSIQLYDIQGRLLQTVLENNTSIVLDITHRSSGVYFLKVTTDKGVKVEKVIRE